MDVFMLRTRTFNNPSHLIPTSITDESAQNIFLGVLVVVDLGVMKDLGVSLSQCE